MNIFPAIFYIDHFVIRIRTKMGPLLMELPCEVFSIDSHPTEPMLAVGLVSGEVQWCCLSNDRAAITNFLRYSYNYSQISFGPVQWETKRHKSSCRSVRYSPSGSLIASAGADGLIKWASADTGNVLYKNHTGSRF